MQSIIQGTDGRYLPGTFFAHYPQGVRARDQAFQIIQDQPGALRFVLVKAGRYSDDALAEILATFRRYLGVEIAIEVEVVDNIKLVRTGKRLATVSKLDIDFQHRAPTKVAP